MPMPKKGLLMSQRRYAEAVAEVNAANERDERTFYGRQLEEY